MLSATTNNAAAEISLASSASEKFRKDGVPPQASRRTLLPVAAEAAPPPPTTTTTTTTPAAANNTHSHSTTTTHLTSSSSAADVAVNATHPSSSTSSSLATEREQVPQQQPVPQSRRVSITHCPDPQTCVTLDDRIASLSVDQAWALIHQSVLMYRSALQSAPGTALAEAPLVVPNTPQALCLHRDGSVHIAADATADVSLASTQRKILLHLGYVVYTALNMPNGSTELTAELDEVIGLMSLDDEQEEETEGGEEEKPQTNGVDGAVASNVSGAADCETEDETGRRTLDGVLALCAKRVEGEPNASRAHYRAVCRALVTESLDLREFLRKVCKNGDHKPKAATTLCAAGTDDGDLVDASHRELQSFGFSEWTRFWIQVVDELRRGVRLKKHSGTRPSQLFELTPYEILMEDIRSRNYELRKVMVDGEVPAEARVVKHDAHAVILEFIRSRPPLRKAAERTLAPLRVQPTPREMLMDSIRQGQVLRNVHVVPASQPHPRQMRVIKVDMSLFDDDDDDDENASTQLNDTRTANKDTTPATNASNAQIAVVAGAASATVADVVVHRRKTNNNNASNNHNNNLNNQHNHRTSKRRHTIVGCQSNGDLTAATPPTRPESRESQHSVTINPLNPLNAMTQQALAEWTGMPLTDDDDDDDDEHNDHNNVIIGIEDITNEDTNDDDDDDEDDIMRDISHHQLDRHHQALHHDDTDIDIPHATPADLPEHTSDRLTLSLEEIVHIRSVMTKAELEGLPVGVQVKEDVERRKVCFLCLRTRFSLFRQWGVQCKLCQRTVCTKCHTKMRIPTEHFRNVPVMLLSASLMGSPVTASAPLAADESYQRTLFARSLRPDASAEAATVSSVYGGSMQTAGSAPTTPRLYHHRSGTAAASAAAAGGVACGAPTSTAATVRGAAHALALHHHRQQQHHHHHHHHQQHDMAMMSRSMDAAALSAAAEASSTGQPRSLPPQSPATRSHPNTLDRQTRFARAFNRSPSQANTVNQQHAESCHRDVLRGELSSVCNDCRDLVNNICRSSKQTRSSARNKALRNLTLDLSPVYK